MRNVRLPLAALLVGVAGGAATMHFAVPKAAMGTAHASDGPGRGRQG